MFQKLLCWLGLHRRPPANEFMVYAINQNTQIRLPDMPESRWECDGRFVVAFRCIVCGQEVLE